MDYSLISTTPFFAHIQFSGRFNNSEVTWNAKIQTLKSITPKKSNIGLRQFINISTNNSNLMDISIGLNVKFISKPEILKTIIMITNYKNLKMGLHEYGELYFFT